MSTKSFKRCRCCGATYSHAEWERLEHVGTDWMAGELIYYANCAACHSTMCQTLALEWPWTYGADELPKMEALAP